MKRIIALLLSVLLVTAICCACGNAQKSGDNTTKETTVAATSATADEITTNKTEIVVFAAASMTETLESLANTYQATHPEIKITYNFDSSGTLKTQIEEGAVCDLFISAAQKQMNGLEEGGYIDKDTRLDLLENKVALCVAENSKSGIQSYADMKSHLEAGDILMAIGNEDVPVGQYTQKIFTYYSPTAPTSRRSPPRSARAPLTAVSSIRPTRTPRSSRSPIPPPRKCADRSSTPPPY